MNFTRPEGIGFSESFTASYIEQQDRIKKEKAKIEESKTIFSRIKELTKSCSTPEDKKFLKELNKICLSIFQTIKKYPKTSSAIELKSKIVELTNTIFEELSSFTKTTDDEDLAAVLNHNFKFYLQKEINQDYHHFLEGQTPTDDPAFHEFLNIRNDTDVMQAKNSALNKIKKLFDKKGKFFQKRDVLLCIDNDSQPRFNKVWVEDLIADLGKASIKAKTITEALEKSESFSRLQDSYLSGSGLPNVLVLIATDTLHKTKSENGSCGHKEEIWNDAINGMKDAKRKIIPVQLGSHQTFWPNGKFYHSDFQEHLLTEFPVQRKGYHTVLFNIIQPLINDKDLEKYSKIVNAFNQKINKIKGS